MRKVFGMQKLPALNRQFQLPTAEQIETFILDLQQKSGQFGLRNRSHFFIPIQAASKTTTHSWNKTKKNGIHNFKVFNAFLIWFFMLLKVHVYDS